MSQIYQLDDGLSLNDHIIGSKAWTLAKLRKLGILTPDGICISTLAYHQFVTRNQLQMVLSHEFERKHIQSMRWEELWDAAFRIRIAFSKAEFSPVFISELTTALQTLSGDAFAVRSSAVGEDGMHLSFAGLFTSVLQCENQEAIEKAIKEVFASLWSSAAMMYRHELGLNFENSAMAVLIQPMVQHQKSGILFSQDPRSKDHDCLIIECMQGQTAELVSHHREPDHYELSREDGRVLTTHLAPGANSELSAEDLQFLWQTALKIENDLGYPVDIEWSGLHDQFTVLQARPITRLSDKKVDDRQYFLTLTLKDQQLRALGDEVANILIPNLTQLGEHYATLDLEALNDAALAAEIIARQNSLNEWKSIYKFKLVPLAHAVRALGEWYDRLIHPADPYEFIGLLLHEDRLAARRNQIISRAATLLREDAQLLLQVSQTNSWPTLYEYLSQHTNGQKILAILKQLGNEFFDVNFHTERLIDHPDITFAIILKLARQTDKTASNIASKAELTEKLRAHCDTSQWQHASELLKLARLSWRIRDDDDLLLGRLESQLLRAIQVGLLRLYQQKKIIEIPTNTITIANGVCKVLTSTPEKPIKFILDVEEQPREFLYQDTQAQRFLHGLPAAPGIAIGKIRKIHSTQDMRDFQPGEILACEFIDPVMTHLALLAGGIIESRGGMLVHSVIIAREMGIPCVNGIANMLSNIENGLMVEVNGTTGVVRFLDKISKG